MRWEILNKLQKKGIAKILLKNRNIKDEKEFFNPPDPSNTSNASLETLGIKKEDITKAIKRIRLAKKRNEMVFIYGDYDADGICSTAILWEALHGLGINILPHIPNRFEEGYGINSKSIDELKSKNEKLKLIITVDNGIVGFDGIKKANELGIDVIVIDHHAKGEKKPDAFAIIHSVKTSGAGLAYFFAQEVLKKVGSLSQRSYFLKSWLAIASVGVIADQIPLTGINRSIAKFGLTELSKTKRPGLLALFEESGLLTRGPLVNPKIGTYEVNYVIAPRINAMGRLKYGIDSLRLLCTTKKDNAHELAKSLGQTNLSRQKIVDEVVTLARKEVGNKKIIVISGENYHEGVIGLAAGKLVEEFYRPAIVFSKKEGKSKASARSISGFSIIEAIRATGLILEGGGHPMAAGFSIETDKIDMFAKKINTIADKLLTSDLLEKKIKVDCLIDFSQITPSFFNILKQFEPFGIGNFPPLFCTKKVEVLDARTVGMEAKHLKLKLKQGGQVFDSIYFGGGKIYPEITPDSKADIVFRLEENVWNGRISLQLVIRDLRIYN